MQEEHKENAEDTEEVEAHRWYSPPEPGRVANKPEDERGAEDDEVEAHRWKGSGPQHFS